MPPRLTLIPAALALVLGACALDRPAATGALVVGSPAAATVAGRPLPVIPPFSAPTVVADVAGPYLLDTGDRLRVFVYGQPNLSRLYTVDHDGRIVVPLIGAVPARGHTVSSLGATIRDRLAARFLRDPQVTVDVHQNRPFFILGEVKSAGQYPYVSGMTVETAAAIAGGYSERADERRARLSRRVHGVVETREVPPDTDVKPGDTIYILERFL